MDLSDACQSIDAQDLSCTERDGLSVQELGAHLRGRTLRGGVPEDPYPPNLGGGDSHPRFGGWILEKHSFYSVFWRSLPEFGGWSPHPQNLRGRMGSQGSGHLLETPFSEPLPRTLLKTLLYCTTHSRPHFSEPFWEPFPRIGTRLRGRT